jgi:phage shock protein E
MKFIRISPIILFYVFISASLLQASDLQTKVSEKIRNGAIIIDVRTPEEYAEGRIRNAVNIPLSEIHVRLAEFGPKNKPIIVYCRSGRRSAEAKKMLIDNGFSDVTDGGGLDDMPR